jgi:hypothetical protein
MSSSENDPPAAQVGGILKATSPVRTCQWENLDAQMDDDAVPESCSEEACLTTCDPAGAIVCFKHKCRCSRPLDRETGEALDWRYVETFRAGVDFSRHMPGIENTNLQEMFGLNDAQMASTNVKAAQMTASVENPDTDTEMVRKWILRYREAHRFRLACKVTTGGVCRTHAPRHDVECAKEFREVEEEIQTEMFQRFAGWPPDVR